MKSGDCFHWTEKGVESYKKAIKTRVPANYMMCKLTTENKT